MTSVPLIIQITRKCAGTSISSSLSNTQTASTFTLNWNLFKDQTLFSIYVDMA